MESFFDDHIFNQDLPDDATYCNSEQTEVTEQFSSDQESVIETPHIPDPNKIAIDSPCRRLGLGLGAITWTAADVIYQQSCGHTVPESVRHLDPDYIATPSPTESHHSETTAVSGAPNIMTTICSNHLNIKKQNYLFCPPVRFAAKKQSKYFFCKKKS